LLTHSNVVKRETHELSAMSSSKGCYEMKRIKISDYINVVKPSYVFLRLTPNNSIRNNSTHKIAKSIASLYRNLTQNIRKDNAKVVKALGREFLFGTKYTVEMSAKVSYYVYIEKKKVEFYFVIP